MPRNILQDIKIKRPIRRLSVVPPREYEPVVKKEKRKIRPRYTLWLIAGISIIFFLFALSYMFLKVQITIDPKVTALALNQNLSANKNGDEDALLFDLLVISGEETRSISATEEKDVLRKARGIAVIYNNFSVATQRLDVDTRLEGSNGKIYKTEKQIIVPGMVGDKPGQVEVGIRGAEEGEQYNSGPLDFTIVGFKGGPKYSKFYGRSKGDMTGGFKGKTRIVSDEQETAMVDSMKTALQTKLFKKATDQIPKGFVLFKDAVVLKIDENNIDSVEPVNNTLSLKIKGTLYGFLFNEEKLTQKIVEKNLSGYDESSSVYLLNMHNLAFSPSGSSGVEGALGTFGATPNPADVKDINFNLQGSVKVVWKLDETKLAADLLGKSKKDFDSVLSKYPNINSADLVISPFWKMSFPDKTKDIKVIVNYPSK